VPQGALAFGVIRNVGELDKKIAAIAQELQIPVPSPLMAIRAQAGIQEGLDEKGALVFAIFPPTERQDPVFPGLPLPVLLVPVTDYAKFVGQFNPDDAKSDVVETRIGAIMKHGNYAAITAPHEKDRLKEVLAAKGGVQGLPAALTTWAGDHDAYFVALPEGIKRAIGPIRQGLQQAKGAFPADNEQFKSVAAIFDVYDKMLSTIASEVTHFGAGLRIDEGTVYLNSHSVFVPNGSLAQAAEEAKRPDQSGLAMLPSGTYFMAFEGVVPGAWLKGMSAFSTEIMRSMATQGGGKPLSDEEVRQLSEAMQRSMAGMKSMAMRVGVMQPGKSLYDSISGVMKVENSREFLTGYEKSIREMSKAFEKSENPLFGSYEISKGEVGGVSTLQISMDMSEFFKSIGDPNAERMMKLMMGQDGKLTAYIAAADATTVAMSYSEEGLTEVLDSAKNKGRSLATQEDVAQTMKLLPKESQWVGFLSPKGMLEFVKVIVQAVAPGGAGQLPPFPETPPVGFGARMTPQGFDTSLVVPKETLAGISSYALMIRQIQPGVNGVQPPARRLQPRR
jgi:hypothetical protein